MCEVTAAKGKVTMSKGMTKVKTTKKTLKKTLIK